MLTDRRSGALLLRRLVRPRLEPKETLARASVQRATEPAARPSQTARHARRSHWRTPPDRPPALAGAAAAASRRLAWDEQLRCVDRDRAVRGRSVPARPGRAGVRAV